MMLKNALRSEARLRRARAAAGLASFAEKIAGFAQELSLQHGWAVASYWPMAGEADPRALARALNARGHTILLPRINGLNEPLSFRHWRDGDAIEKSPLGVNEPLDSAPAARPDAVFVPLLAFDAQGFRLGYGGGYYDRCLASLRAQGAVLAIGIAYAEQEMAALPHEAHDEKLDLVVTEKGVRRFG
jgi:5-formyltetrahydrofolate cyclo-ligase